MRSLRSSGGGTEAVKAAIALSSARPTLSWAGGGATAPRGRRDHQARFDLSIPIATSLHAKAIVPDEHPLNVGVPGSYSRSCANKAVQAADLVFFIGSHSGGQVTNGWQIPKFGTPTIQLDINPEELGRNYPNAVSLCGDAKVVVGQLIEAAGSEPTRRAEWLEQARSYVSDYWAESEPARTSDALPMRPERVCKEIEQWLPGNATLVVDTFTRDVGAQMIKMKDGQSFCAAAARLAGDPGGDRRPGRAPRKPWLRSSAMRVSTTTWRSSKRRLARSSPW